MEVRFPSIQQIEADPNVRAFTDAEWAATLDDCTETQRRERGFWIFYDAGLDRYTKGESMVGRWVMGAEQAGVNLGYPPDDIPTVGSPVDIGQIYSVASFHTHTPTTYFPIDSPGRPAGGSSGDSSNSILMQRPSILCDFIASGIRSGWIPARHPKESPA